MASSRLRARARTAWVDPLPGGFLREERMPLTRVEGDQALDGLGVGSVPPPDTIPLLRTGLHENDDTRPAGPCYQNSGAWESEIVEIRQAAATICRNDCAMLAECMQYAAQHTWAPGIVIAGWEARPTKSMAPRRPPWASTRKRGR